METISKQADNIDFQTNKLPAMLRKKSLTINKGTDPNIIPDGQRYLQNQGSPKPDSSCRITSGNRITKRTSTAYFKYLVYRSLTFNLGVLILYNKSCNRPIGQT